VENSSASRRGEVVLLPHDSGSPAIAARARAFLRKLKISAPKAALRVGLLHSHCYNMRAAAPHRSINPTILPFRFIRTPRPEYPEKPDQKAKIASSRPVSPEIRPEIPFSGHPVR
jgi:hypothetical protein